MNRIWALIGLIAICLSFWVKPARADDYSLSCALAPEPSVSHSGFAISGNVLSYWSGHMGDSWPYYNRVKVMTGVHAKMYYDIYFWNPYISSWSYYNHGGYVEASHGLNPEWSDEVAWNSDFEKGFLCDIDTDFASWFSAEKPNDSNWHYVLTAVSYQLTQSAEIYVSDLLGDALIDPPGIAFAPATYWYSL